ncbi:hypothetical protein PCO85_11770 [Prodigiosinella aquatilis]|nr:hypothetical protein [Prodigiosinella sp. LS101]WJV51948.1 hypothetical protein PCO85_11770 [Prodigiosinella sp. LS101]WJV56304.1 hypothetical protein PCO84_11770 [Pectobacteriaceae bacterium C111]
MRITSLEQDPGPRAGIVVFSGQTLRAAFILPSLNLSGDNTSAPGQEMFCHYRHADGMTKPPGQGDAPTPYR